MSEIKEMEKDETKSLPEYVNKTIFTNAGKAGADSNWNGDRFADGTYHKIDFFYLERGNNESNLQIRFNMVNTGDFTAHKALVEKRNAEREAELKKQAEWQGCKQGNQIQFQGDRDTVFQNIPYGDVGPHGNGGSPIIVKQNIRHKVAVLFDHGLIKMILGVHRFNCRIR